MKIKNKLRNFKFRRGKLYMVWLVGGLFMVVTVFFTIQSAAIGAKLSHLENEEAAQIDENRKLVLKVIESTSLSKTGDVSEDLGFAKPTKTIYISEIDTVAILP